MLDSFFQIVVMYASKPTHTESKEKIRQTVYLSCKATLQVRLLIKA